jgi:hypothetical protein
MATRSIKQAHRQHHARSVGTHALIRFRVLKYTVASAAS